MKIYSLLDQTKLAQHLLDRNVRAQDHPEFGWLRILNYTERAAYDRIWDDVTTKCRGLIYDTATFEVLARPFPKFFNHGEPAAAELNLADAAVVTEKMDGSLGILYPTPAGPAIATRGSFASEQALHATALLRDRYAGWAPTPRATYLFEIVYPENRIVVDYRGLDDLILLDALDLETGRPTWSYGWPGPRVDEHPFRTLAEALAAEPRQNAEGLVVYFPNQNARVKVKQDDYVALHRIVTGLNERTVWQHVCDGKPLPELLLPLPDEFRPWVEEVAARLTAQVTRQGREIEDEYGALLDDLEAAGEWNCAECGGGLRWTTYSVPGNIDAPPTHAWACTTAGGCGEGFVPVRPPRKNFALRAAGSPWAWALFLRLDGRDYTGKLWRMARPDAVGPSGRVYTEDVA